jgi:predicted RNase H-like HicB family nuclease
MNPKVTVESYTFRAVVEPDFFEDGTPAYHAYIPALPGCFSWGYTVEEALRNLEATRLIGLSSCESEESPSPRNALLLMSHASQ